MVLGQYRALRHMAARDVDQRVAREIRIAGVQLGAGAFNQRLKGVRQHDRYVAHVALRDFRPREDHRYARRLLVHRRFAPHAARAEIVAVVRRVEHAGVGGESGRFQRRKNLADVVIEERSQSEVGRDGASHHGRIERLVEALAFAHGISERMARALGLLVHERPRHVFFRIHVEELLGRDEWKVWRHETDVQHPRLGAVLGRFLFKPPLRMRGDVAVVLGVFGFARPGFRSQFFRALAHRQFVAYEAQQIADAVDDMHG